MKGKRKAAPSGNLELRVGEEEGQVKEENGNGVGDGEAIGRDEVNDNLEEEEEAEEGEDGDGEGEEEEEGKDGDEEGQEERPKLDEGFFEIEAIRRKRVRKGQLQYFIKWRGWPETSNTWEPLENLQSCSDVIDAFEESLRSGKSSRKRKRKSAGLQNQPKKKQPRSSAAHSVDVEIGKVGGILPSASLNNPCMAQIGASMQNMASANEGEDNRDVSIKTVGQGDENGPSNGSKKLLEMKEDNEYDPKLSELRGTPTSEVNADKLAVHFRDGKALEGNDPTDGLLKADQVEPVPNNCRTGSKRRKSGPVRRFKKDSALGEPTILKHSSSNMSIGSGGTIAQQAIPNANLAWSNPILKPLHEDSISASTIIKILKPIGFSATVLDNVQDVHVTFVALSSDGKEVTVDNKFLKANNPQLLIDFYEQHLKYST